MRAFSAKRNGWGCCGAALICAFLIKPAQDLLQSRAALEAAPPDLLLFSSPGLVKKMALGYDALMADLYWVRTIQYYGRREEAAKRPVRYGSLAALLDITTTLDPHMIDAYRAGAAFLSEPDPIGAGQPKEALRLLDKGIRSNPRQWRLLFDKGFVHYIYLKDYEAAGEVWLEASRLPGVPEWMGRLAAATFSKGGALDAAAYLWERQYEEAARADVRENARNNLMAIRAAKDLRAIRALVKKYREEIGAFPPSLEALLRISGRSFNRTDPLGAPYRYDFQTGAVKLDPESKIKPIDE